jgi:hypothetical protein
VVVTDWDGGILELWETINDNSDIIKIEKMYRKIYDKERKKIKDLETDNIVITFRGGQTRCELWLWNKRAAIKVRPYIMPVKQCYKCFRYGHIKAFCRSEERCIICGDKAHGRCTKEEKCRNCNGQHRSTDRKCLVREKNKNIQTIMAYHNVTYNSARRILEGREETKNTAYDRYKEPENWPKLPPTGRYNTHTEKKHIKEGKSTPEGKKEYSERNQIGEGAIKKTKYGGREILSTKEI